MSPPRPAGSPTKTRRHRLRWVNVLPGPTRSLRNCQWEAIDGPFLRFYAVFMGITDRGLAEWELNQWHHGTRSAYGPFGTLTKCKVVAEYLRSKAHALDAATHEPRQP